MRRSNTDHHAKRRRRILLLLLLASLLFYSLALSQGWLDRTPPELSAQNPRAEFLLEGRSRCPSARANLLSSTTRTTGQTAEAVTQNLRLKLPARVGENGLELTATDGAENVTTARYTVTGVPEARPRVQATEAVVAGDPVGVQLSFTTDPEIESVAVTLDGALLRGFSFGGAGGGVRQRPAGLRNERAVPLTRYPYRRIWACDACGA